MHGRSVCRSQTFLFVLCQIVHIECFLRTERFALMRLEPVGARAVHDQDFRALVDAQLAVSAVVLRQRIRLYGYMPFLHCFGTDKRCHCIRIYRPGCIQRSDNRTPPEQRHLRNTYSHCSVFASGISVYRPLPRILAVSRNGRNHTCTGAS